MSLTKNELNRTVAMLQNPRMRCVPDQITGKKYSLCLMETADEHENRIQRHISYYMPPKELIAFIYGYYEARNNPGDYQVLD